MATGPEPVVKLPEAVQSPRQRKRKEVYTMSKYFTAKRTDSTARKILAIVLNLLGYAVITFPFYCGLI